MESELRVVVLCLSLVALHAHPSCAQPATGAERVSSPSSNAASAAAWSEDYGAFCEYLRRGGSAKAGTNTSIHWTATFEGLVEPKDQWTYEAVEVTGPWKNIQVQRPRGPRFAFQPFQMPGGRGEVWFACPDDELQRWASLAKAQTVRLDGVVTSALVLRSRIHPDGRKSVPSSQFVWVVKVSAAAPAVPAEPPPAKTAEPVVDPTGKTAQVQRPGTRGGTAETTELTLDLGNKVTMKLVQIPAGQFLMGSPSGQGDDSEHPQHRVRISRPFYMGKYEVTQGQWEAVMGNNASNVQGDPNLPAQQVSWKDCQEFCQRLSANTGRQIRLPTEAEWEYACRAGGTTQYGYGDSEGNLGEYAWYRGNSGIRAHPVGQKQPNAWGLYDMHGNALEWCQDPYGKDYYGRSPANDPPGPNVGDGGLLRGGSSVSNADDCRSACRSNRSGWDWRLVTNGLRVVSAGVDSGESTAPASQSGGTRSIRMSIAQQGKHLLLLPFRRPHRPRRSRS